MPCLLAEIAIPEPPGDYVAPQTTRISPAGNKFHATESCGLESSHRSSNPPDPATSDPGTFSLSTSAPGRPDPGRGPSG